VHNIELPDEYRLKNVNIKIVLKGPRGNEEFLLVEYFSMLDYSAIPCIQIEKYYLPCKEILLKFFFIELWVIFNIYHSKNISNTKYINHVNKVWESITNVKDSFPEPEYIIGYNIPYVEYRKYLALRSIKLPDYRPYDKNVR